MEMWVRGGSGSGPALLRPGGRERFPDRCGAVTEYHVKRRTEFILLLSGQTTGAS